MEENREFQSWKLSSRHIVYRNAVLGYFSTLDLKENCSEKLFANAELGLAQRSTSEWYRSLPWLTVHLHWYNGKIQCWPSMNFWTDQPDPGIDIPGFFIPARLWHRYSWIFHTSQILVLRFLDFSYQPGGPSIGSFFKLSYQPGPGMESFFFKLYQPGGKLIFGWCNTKQIQNSRITLQKVILTHIMIATFQPTRPIIVPYHMK